MCVYVCAIKSILTYSDLFQGFLGIVQSTQKWFTIPFFWGHPGTVQLVQGHTGWLFWDAQWGPGFPTNGFTAGFLTH